MKSWLWRRGSLSKFVSWTRMPKLPVKSRPWSVSGLMLSESYKRWLAGNVEVTLHCGNSPHFQEAEAGG